MKPTTLAAALSELRSEIWAILPAYQAAMVQALAGGAELEAARPADVASLGAVAVIPVSGPIFPRGGGILEILFGGVSAERLAQSLQQAANDSTVSAIVLDVNSPGGAVSGVTEAAARVRETAKQKPVVAIANHLAASAAYWIASQTSHVMVSPSAEVGSIGVFAAHQDWSKALAEAGINVSLISAGKYKTEANPYEPLGDEARAAIQARVDEYYAAFVGDVAKGRNVSRDDVRGGFGEGRVVGAREALAGGMADSVGTLADAVRLAAKLAQKPGAELEMRQRRARMNEHV